MGTVIPFPVPSIEHTLSGGGFNVWGGAGDVRHVATGWAIAIAGFVAYMHAAGLSPHTIALRSKYLGRLAADVGHANPWAVGPQDLLGWMARPGWSPETRKSARQSVVRFYGWAVDTDQIRELDSPARRLPAVSVPRGVPRPAPDRVVTPALWSSTDRDRLFVMLAAYAGLRRAEIAAVHPKDIDHDTQQLIVRGKGRRERWVPLHPDLYAELIAELDRRAAGGVGTGYRYSRYVEPDGWLFPGRAGHVTPDVPGRVLSRLLGEGWTAHTLRHRFATRAYAAERDLRAVQELLGHSKPETTARYVQTPPDAMRRAVDAVA